MFGPEMAQAVQEAAKEGPATVTVIGLAILVVSSVGIWLDKFVQMSKNRVAKEEAEAREAEAKTKEAEVKAASGKGNSQSAHDKWILPHSVQLERHDGELKALGVNFNKIERENREDHGKLFSQIGEVKSLIIDRLPKR